MGNDTTADDVKAFEALAVKLGSQMEAGNTDLWDLLARYGEPLQRVLVQAREMAK